MVRKLLGRPLHMLLTSHDLRPMQERFTCMSIRSSSSPIDDVTLVTRMSDVAVGQVRTPWSRCPAIPPQDTVREHSTPTSESRNLYFIFVPLKSHKNIFLCQHSKFVLSGKPDSSLLVRNSNILCLWPCQRWFFPKANEWLAKSTERALSLRKAEENAGWWAVSVRKRLDNRRTFTRPWHLKHAFTLILLISLNVVTPRNCVYHVLFVCLLRCNLVGINIAKKDFFYIRI
jgi:hypothetical protein